MKPTHLIGSILMGIGLGLIIFAFAIHNNLFFSNYRAFIITSSSMEPKIKAGAAVFTKSSSNYTQGDIISFKDGDSIITHRIVAKLTDDNGPYFLTSGDATEQIDQAKVRSNMIVGKTYLVAPKLGYLANFAQTPKGFVALIIIPASIIIYEEIKNIFFELKNLLKKIVKKDERGIGLKKALALPILSSSMLLMFASQSFFSDQQTSITNTIIAFSEEEEPGPENNPNHNPPSFNPSDVVINEIYYDVAQSKGNEGNSANPDEWIELYNNTDNDINLQNWSITDNNNSKLLSHPAKYIPAKGFALITKSAKTWAQYWTLPEPTQTIELGQKIGNGLSNTGDYIILKDPSGNIIDQLSYGSQTSPPPSLPDVNEGQSLERNPTGKDTDSLTDFIINDNPTPGL